MPVEWMTCSVPENKKVAFSHAQEQWSSMGAGRMMVSCLTFSSSGY
ncbi:MAG: hypothetical protein ACI35R_18740 [Bacillus sp. (in: firmicutes)]